jgi:formylglycine-generating enzyme required for sulfatase activity
MVQIPGGRFRMGSTGFYPEEAPVREVELGTFAIDRTPVIGAQFSRFTEETGYLTVAERPVDPTQYPDADASIVHAGSADRNGERTSASAPTIAHRGGSQRRLGRCLIPGRSRAATAPAR